MKHTRSNEQDDQATGEGMFRSTDELTEAARSYFASDFANPQRRGCPPQEKLRVVARSSSLPGDDLRVHLFACSECFREYREAVRLRSSLVPVHTAGRLGVVFQSKPVFAVAAAILLAVLSVLVVVSVHRSARTEAIARDGEAGSPSDGQSSNASKQSEPPSPASDRPLASHLEGSLANKKSAPHLASNYQEIDLENYAHYRGASDQSGSANKPINLNTSINHVLFRLPDVGPRGRYRVVIKNPRMDQTILSADARSVDGKTLKTILDLRRLAAKRYVLCVSPEALAPFCYDLHVRH